MNILDYSHQSILRFTSTLAAEFSQVDGQTVEAINLDAVASEGELPTTDFVGMQNFVMYSSNDENPLNVVSAMIVCATYSDASNMRLMARLNAIFDSLQPGDILPYYNDNNEVIGSLKVKGTTRLMPVMKNTQVAMQGITFQAAIQANN